MSRRPHLTLVPKGIQKLSAREDLIKESAKVFPLKGGEDQESVRRIESMRAKWVEAKLAVCGRQLKVRIGTDQAITFQRQLRGASFDE